MSSLNQNVIRHKIGLLDISISASPHSAAVTRSQTPLLASAGEADKCPVPMPEFFRQITPRAAGAHDPENGLDKAPIVLGGAARVALFAWQ